MTIHEYARQLRQESTKAEQILWKRLRNRKFQDLKFRRQSVIQFRFIVDFYCAEKKLIIEVDGLIHKKDEVKINDETREKRLIEMGYHIIRFENWEVENQLNKVLKSLEEILR